MFCMPPTVENACNDNILSPFCGKTLEQLPDMLNEAGVG